MTCRSVPSVRKGNEDDQAAGGHAAQVPVTLDEDGPGPVPGRGHRRGDARRPAADHEDISLEADGMSRGQ